MRSKRVHFNHRRRFSFNYKHKQKKVSKIVAKRENYLRYKDIIDEYDKLTVDTMKDLHNKLCEFLYAKIGNSTNTSLERLKQCNFGYNALYPDTSCGLSASALLSIRLCHDFNNCLYGNFAYVINHFLTTKLKRFLWVGISSHINLNNIVFPGHSFVLEEVDNDKFLLIQSYVQKYDIKKWFTKDDKILINLCEVKNLFAWLKKFNENGVVTRKIIKMWKRLTGISIKHLEGLQVRKRSMLFVMVE